MAELITVDVDYSFDGDKRYYAISLSTHTWLMLIHIPPEEVPRLSEVTSRPWDQGALRIGDSAGASAFWSTNGEEDRDVVVIVIGQDDETWDISVAIPATTIDSILDAIKSLDAP